MRNGQTDQAKRPGSLGSARSSRRSDSLVAAALDIGRVLADRDGVTFRAVGACMYPVVRPGDVLRIRSCAATDASVGDVVVCRGSGNLFGHRVVAKGGHDGRDYVVTRADRARHGDDAPTFDDDLLGVVVSITRGGVPVPLQPVEHSLPARGYHGVRLFLVKAGPRARLLISEGAAPLQDAAAYRRAARRWMEARGRVRLAVRVPLNETLGDALCRELSPDEFDPDGTWHGRAVERWTLIAHVRDGREPAAGRTYVRGAGRAWRLDRSFVRARYRGAGLDEALARAAAAILAGGDGSEGARCDAASGATADAEIERRILLLCARPPDADAAERLCQALGRIRDWPALATAAVTQKMAPLTYLRFAGSCGAGLPAEARDQLAGFYLTAVKRGMALSGQLVGLLDLLAGAGIAALPFKGPVLAQQAYGDPGSRQFSDLDILVAERDAAAARELLLAHGFARTKPSGMVPDAVLLRDECEMALRRAADELVVDLHWRVGWRFADASVPAETFFARGAPLSLGSRQVPAPDPTDTLLIACLHGSHHAWQTIEMLATVAVLAARVAPAEWPDVLRRAERLGCRRRVLTGVLIASAATGCAPPEEVARRAAADPAAARLARIGLGMAGSGAVHASAGRIVWQARTLDSAPAAARLLVRRALVPGRDDWDTLRLPARLYWLYYLWRPLRLIGKFARARKT